MKNRSKMMSMVAVGLISYLLPLTSYLLTSCTSIECSINSLVRTRYQFTNSAGDSISDHPQRRLSDRHIQQRLYYI